ncbi:MAG: HTH domain-containing protein [Acidimicrobiia bacterium]|nr:HTH domain-containing protein [Acidimicrobiia bacterium]
MTAPELSVELEVSVRTIMRDIEALGVAGIPVYSVRGPQGGFEIWGGFKSVLRAMSADEAAALALMAAPGHASALGLGDVVERARRKLRNAMPAELAVEAEALDHQLVIDAEPWGGGVPIQALQFLTVAIKRRREIRVQPVGGSELTVHPLGLAHKVGEWWLVAVVDSMVQAFRVIELRGYATTGSRFERPVDFDLSTWWRNHVATASP